MQLQPILLSMNNCFFIPLVGGKRKISIGVILRRPVESKVIAAGITQTSSDYFAPTPAPDRARIRNQKHLAKYDAVKQLENHDSESPLAAKCKIVLDVLYERRSPFNPSEVVAEIVALMRQYRCTKISCRA